MGSVQTLHQFGDPNQNPIDKVIVLRRSCQTNQSATKYYQFVGMGLVCEVSMRTTSRQGCLTNLTHRENISEIKTENKGIETRGKRKTRV
jgi:hypothetical protein